MYKGDIFWSGTVPRVHDNKPDDKAWVYHEVKDRGRLGIGCGKKGGLGRVKLIGERPLGLKIAIIPRSGTVTVLSIRVN